MNTYKTMRELSAIEREQVAGGGTFVGNGTLNGFTGHYVAYLRGVDFIANNPNEDFQNP